MPTKYVIIEDEALAADRLESEIMKLRPEWELISVIESVRMAIKNLESLQPDLIFLDIHLSDGNSFAIFDSLKPKAPIVFTTAYDKYALKAFEQNSLDYLLKPIGVEELQRAIKKFESRVEGNNGIDWSSLLKEIKPSYKERFIVSAGQRLKSLAVENLSFIFAQGKHTFLTDKEGTQYMLEQSLSSIAESLNPKKFFQINRQYIVCHDCIDEMIPYSKSRLKIITKVPTPTDAIVSVDRAPKFKKWLEGE